MWPGRRKYLCALLGLAISCAPLICAAEDTPAVAAPAISIDKTAVNNGGEIVVSGRAPAGKPVFIEVWSEKAVRASFFDGAKDQKTGVVPYKLYLSDRIPSHYRIYVPADKADMLKKAKAEGGRWSYSRWLNETGAAAAYSAPGGIAIDAYQSSLVASIIGSRGPKLASLNAQETRARSMQLVKARFRSVDALLSPSVQMSPDGSFTAKVRIPAGAAPGK